MKKGKAVESHSGASVSDGMDEVSKLWKTIGDAMEKLARLASQSQNPKNHDAAVNLAWLPLKAIQRVREILELAPQDSPSELAYLSFKWMSLAVNHFELFMRAYPKAFAPFMKWESSIPTVRYLRDDETTFHRFAKSLQLGEGFRLKEKGVSNTSTQAKQAVHKILIWLEMSRTFPKCAAVSPRWREGEEFFFEASEIPLNNPTFQKVARIEYPPLTRERVSLEFWWKNGVKPLLEMKWDTDQDFKNSFKSCGHRKRVKSESDFKQEALKDCRQALETLASTP